MSFVVVVLAQVAEVGRPRRFASGLRHEPVIYPQTVVALDSVLTCPSCGRQATEPMPEDACQYFYECTCCGKILKPRAGDCCVFCSYGTVVCPPMQTQGGGSDAVGLCC
jgi:hypothetical protein